MDKMEGNIAEQLSRGYTIVSANDPAILTTNNAGTHALWWM
jgi:hypothetical protein